jgi:hypothetical protein
VRVINNEPNNRTRDVFNMNDMLLSASVGRSAESANILSLPVRRSY